MQLQTIYNQSRESHWLKSLNPWPHLTATAGKVNILPVTGKGQQQLISPLFGYIIVKVYAWAAQEWGSTELYTCDGQFMQILLMTMTSFNNDRHRL